MAKVNGGYQPTQPLPKREPELSFNHSAGELMAVTVKKIRKEALRLISETAINCTGSNTLEAINYVAGVVDLTAALIGEEDDE